MGRFQGYLLVLFSNIRVSDIGLFSNICVSDIGFFFICVEGE